MNRERIRLKAQASFTTNHGWSSRGYLPHYDAAGLTQFITIRLADSVPRHVHSSLEVELQALEASGAAEREIGQQRRRRIEFLLDAGYGSCILAQAEVADIIIQAIGNLSVNGHEVIRWVVMPNHIHMLVRVRSGVSLASMLRFFKGRTARLANKVLNRSGQVWFPEFFDRYIRDVQHRDRVIRYIDENPVKAGLVIVAEDWRFGSAGYLR